MIEQDIEHKDLKVRLLEGELLRQAVNVQTIVTRMEPVAVQTTTTTVTETIRDSQVGL